MTKGETDHYRFDLREVGTFKQGKFIPRMMVPIIQKRPAGVVCWVEMFTDRPQAECAKRCQRVLALLEQGRLSEATEASVSHG